MALIDPITQTLDQTLGTVTTLVAPAPVIPPSIIERVETIVHSYPSVPKTLLVPAAFLAVLYGWSFWLLLSVHVIVGIEMFTEWRLYKTKYNLTAREWTHKMTNKLIGYFALAVLASALGWVGAELKGAINLQVPDWIFMISPSSAGVWIIFSAAQVIRDNIKLLGVALPPGFSKQDAP